MSDLWIIGAGPKALAIAAKAAVLRELGFSTPRICIVEKRGVAANWVAGSGMTDGRLPLGTSPEKDVGFPYTSFYWGSGMNDRVNHEMHRYSWVRFLIARHKYADWIDRGRPAPHHERWSEYLRWVYDQIADQSTLLPGEVVGLAIDGGRWRVSMRDGSHGHADGVVLTGPGKLRMPIDLPVDERILSITTFWNRVGELKCERGARFAVVGAGENAATIAATLGQAGNDAKIDVLSPDAMNYSRGESYVENHLYTDPFQGNWFQLTAENRRDFIRRTDRGVFSTATKQVLDLVESVDVVPGRLATVHVDRMNQLLASIDYDQVRETRHYDYVVMATGFDPLGALLDLLDDATQAEVASCAGLPDLSAAAMEEAIDEDLALYGLKPRLHLPMMAAMSQGPGFANLSCLGRLSDHVLSAYIDLEDRQAES